MFSAEEIANHIGGRLEGNNNLQILGVCDLKNGISKHISFLSNPIYKKYFIPTMASAVIIDHQFDIDRGEKTLIRVKNPSLAFAHTLELFQPKNSKNREIHNSAIIQNDAIVGNNLHLGPGVVIGNNTIIGDNVSIYAGTVIGDNCKIGNHTTIQANVTLYNDILVGNNVNIDSGSIIGADGFGWVTDNDIHHKIPQIGKVVIGNDVWIGANCTIDRGTFEPTLVGDFSKLDNQIHIAHNVSIGKNCLIAAQTGIAGSTIIENNVTIAGQCGIVDNIKISSGTIIGARSAVLQSINKKSFVSGNPARDHKSRTRQDIIIKKLPDVINRIKFIENFIKKLKKG